MSAMSRFGRTILLFAFALAAVFLWLALGQLANANLLSGVLDQLATFTTVFLGIFIEAAPFLLLGTLASGIVEVYVSKDDLARLIPRDPIRGALVGATMGVFFPVCECGVVPLTRKLFSKGLPLSVGVAFLLAAPVFNPIVIASTIAAFGVGKILFLRLGLTLVISTITGLIFSTQKQPEQLLLPSGLHSPPLFDAVSNGAQAGVGGGGSRPSLRDGIPQILTVAVDEFFEMGRYLIIGALLAALTQVIVPRSALLAVSAGPVISVLALIVLAVILSICSTVDAFIALAFAGTFTTGSITAFLVFGPMVDIKSTIMFLGVFKRRAVVYLILLPLVMIILASVFINLNTTW
ncbi:MAG: permease [Chloroflexi bacterium]|nr:permease [Chloroflexota bacterium]